MAAKNTRMFELKLGKLGLALFIGGMSVLVCSMFFLGVYVGKEMEAYPERFSPGLLELMREHLFGSETQTARSSTPAETAKRDVPAGGDEGAASAPVPKPSTPEAAGIASDSGRPAPPVAAGGKVKPGPRPAGNPAVPGWSGGAEDAPVVPGRIEAGRPGTLAEKKPPEPGAGGQGPAPPEAAKPPRPQQEGAFEIQVAAYQDQGKAEQAAARLKSLGYPARIVAREIADKGRWFRVIVGGFESREKAKETAELIAGKVRGVKCVIRPSAWNGGG
jgi:cell division protein FtsN